MSLILVTAPAVPPVSLDEVRAHLRIDEGDDDVSLVGMIDAVTAQLDGAAGLLGRALITQTWRLTLDRFARVVELPLPPLQAVTVITYRDVAGAEQTLAPEHYEVFGIGASCQAEVEFTSWPAGQVGERGGRCRLTITYRAGYGDQPFQVPAPIRAAILEGVATRHMFRESVSAGESFSTLPASAAKALDAYRLWAF